MPKVEIDSPGVTIRLEASEASIAELSKQAIELYREASEVPTQDRQQIGFGGQQVERRSTPAHRDEGVYIPFEPIHAKDVPK